MTMNGFSRPGNRFTGACVVMGVASCGKTTVGELLAEKIGAHFIEGDRLHPATNVTKMSAGYPLNDEDRWPWLTAIGHALAGREAGVASCSALRRKYREKIQQAAQRPICFIYLHGSKTLLAQRMENRHGHFMPPSLLDSQLQTLEPPGADEQALALDISMSIGDIAETARKWLLQQD